MTKKAPTMPKCALCKKPGKVFIAGIPHCGGSHWRKPKARAALKEK